MLCVTNHHSNMTTITMPNAIQGAIQAMCEDAISQAIVALSTKYGFDASEAQRELNLGKIQVKVASKSSSDKKAAEPDKPKAKRGPTGYLLFTKELRPEVKAELEAELADGEKVKPQNVVTTLAARWKALADEEKEVWNAKAKSPTSSDDEAVSPEDKEPEPKESKAKEPKAKEPKAKEPKAKESKAKEPKKDQGESSDAPKKRPNGYLMFAKEMRADIKEALEAELEEGEKLKPQAVVTEIAAQWKALDDEEKEVWNAKAKSPQPSDAESD